MGLKKSTYWPPLSCITPWSRCFDAHYSSKHSFRWDTSAVPVARPCLKYNAAVSLSPSSTCCGLNPSCSHRSARALNADMQAATGQPDCSLKIGSLDAVQHLQLVAALWTSYACRGLNPKWRSERACLAQVCSPIIPSTWDMDGPVTIQYLLIQTSM